MKATSIFGGVQVFNILINLVRGKAVAVLIGPNGMGLNALFLSGMNLVKNITSLGLTQSAVRDLAKSYGEDTHQFNKTYTVFRSWIWFTALLGVSISIIFAPFLSRFAFGDSSQTYGFMLLSVTFVFTALSGGIYTVLRASRKVTFLAKANIYGSLSGLLVSIPILFFWRNDGVLPSIIAASFVAYLISLMFRKYVDVQKIELTLKEKFELGKPMVEMGISMSLSAFLASAATFVLSSFISRVNGLSDLGLYSASNSIMVGYVGMVFSAMSADYVPRLSQLIQKKEQWTMAVNQQAEIVLLILTVVLSLMMGSVGVLIRLLLSDEFLETSGFILLLGLSIPMKGLVWALSYVYLAKGESKFFLLTEMIANLIFLFFNILGYAFNGLIGIGVAQILAYATSLLLNLYFIRKKYEFIFSLEVKKTFLVSMFFLILIYLTTLDYGLAYMIALKWVLIACALLYAVFLLNSRMDFLSSIKHKFGK
jgi:O-antigen/teichoic acid export membrane protein